VAWRRTAIHDDGRETLHPGLARRRADQRVAWRIAGGVYICRGTSDFPRYLCRSYGCRDPSDARGEVCAAEYVVLRTRYVRSKSRGSISLTSCNRGPSQVLEILDKIRRAHASWTRRLKTTNPNNNSTVRTIGDYVDYLEREMDGIRKRCWTEDRDSEVFASY
jgi:hypothetical protein